MQRPNLRVAIDCTAAVRQGAGIGRYTRELVRALLAGSSSPSSTDDGGGEQAAAVTYTLFAAVGGLPDAKRRMLDIEPPSASQQSLKHRVRVRPWPVTDRFLNVVWHRLRLPVPAELLTGSVDVFHSPDFTLPPLARARGLLTVHDLSFLRCPESAHPAQRAYLEAAVPRSVARADHILADSQSTKDDLIDLLGVPACRITVVYPAVEPRFRRVADPAALAGISARYRLPERFVLFVGTLQPRKNLVRLIEAFNCLVETTRGSQSPQAENASLKLVLIGGKGWLYEEIFQAVDRLRLEDSVIFPGYVEDADLPAIYSLAELFVFPSLYEGFGLPVLEAMACGCPVVTSDVSSLPEAAGQAGLLVSPADMGALAEAMRRLLGDDELRTRLIEGGYAQARRFTWEAAAQRTRALYWALASGLAS